MAFSDFYKKALCTSAIGKTVYGEPIYFSVTIPESTVINLAGAVSFVTFLLSSDGQRVLQIQGLDYIKSVVEGKMNKMPIDIKNMIYP